MLNLEETDLEFDIESEFEDAEHSHAIPFCYVHKDPEWFPVSGTIVQVLCGRLIRMRYFNGYNPKDKCEDCANFHGITNCYACGTVISG